MESCGSPKPGSGVEDGVAVAVEVFVGVLVGVIVLVPVGVIDSVGVIVLVSVGDLVAVSTLLGVAVGGSGAGGAGRLNNNRASKASAVNPPPNKYQGRKDPVAGFAGVAGSGCAGREADSRFWF